MQGRRIAFAGTPEFAVPTLEALVAAGARVPLVLTQPDRPAGRGRRITPPPVRLAACASSSLSGSATAACQMPGGSPAGPTSSSSLPTGSCCPSGSSSGPARAA